MRDFLSGGDKSSWRIRLAVGPSSYQQERVIARWRRIALKARLAGVIINVEDKVINMLLPGYLAAFGGGREEREGVAKGGEGLPA